MTDKIYKLILLLTLVVYLLYGLASLMPLETMWGLNHISFLPFGSSVIFYAGLVVILMLLIASPPEKIIGQLESAIVRVVANYKARIIIALGFCLFFYGLRMETHFLGDGYSWLSLLGQGESSFHKFAEPGSLYLVRWMQSLLGGYTEQSALRTFQILSILSGGVVIYNLLDIVNCLKDKGVSSILSLSTLLFSGHMLLYFGYVEFYPLSWAVSLVFINCSLKYLQTEKGLLWVVFSYLVAVAVHLQALYFLPALCYLIVIKFRSAQLKKIGYALMGFGAIVGIIFLVWLSRTEPAFEVLILLPFLFMKEKNQPDSTTFWLSWLSLGSLSFLIIYGAGITMAFDWDIFSLTALPLMLLLLYLSRQLDIKAKGKFISIYLFVCLFTAGSFVYANVNTASSELRYYSLLNDNHRSSWVMYADYFKKLGNKQKQEKIIAEMNQKFPDYLTLSKGYSFISERKYDSAFVLAETLYKKNPFNADFSQLLGNVYGKKQIYDSAEYYYLRAITLKPYNTGIQNELGQLYTREGKFAEAITILKKAKGLTPKTTAITESMAVAYLRQDILDSAQFLANELFAENSDSPGGHLILLAIALHQGDELTATFHYNMFLKLGEGRSDYKSIFEYYNYLNQRHLK